MDRMEGGLGNLYRQLYDLIPRLEWCLFKSRQVTAWGPLMDSHEFGKCRFCHGRTQVHTLSETLSYQEGVSEIKSDTECRLVPINVEESAGFSMNNLNSMCCDSL